MIITIVSQKGGSGKTTAATNLAVLAAVNSVSVALVDLDPQASAMCWHAVRQSDDIRLEACHPPALERTLKRLTGDGVQLILIDTPPHNSTAASTSIRLSDFVLVPVRPASFDLAAVADTAILIDVTPFFHPTGTRDLG